VFLKKRDYCGISYYIFLHIGCFIEFPDNLCDADNYGESSVGGCLMDIFRGHPFISCGTDKGGVISSCYN
jgi:hypothetical protein